jgi:hypothetical protein
MIRCASIIDGVSFQTSNRNRVAVSLYHLCIEHHTGIHTLVDNNVYGSAFALVRPQFEAFVRGAWYHRCASDNQIDKFLRGGEPPPIKEQIETLEALDGFSGGFLKGIKDNAWKNLSDFTHGGAIQVKARNTTDEVVSRYKSEHVAGIVSMSVTLSLLAAVGISAVAGDDMLATKLWEECLASTKSA